MLKPITSMLFLLTLVSCVITREVALDENEEIVMDYTYMEEGWEEDWYFNNLIENAKGQIEDNIQDNIMSTAPLMRRIQTRPRGMIDCFRNLGKSTSVKVVLRIIINYEGQVLAIKAITPHILEHEECMVWAMFEAIFEESTSPIEMGEYTYKIKK